MEVIQAKFMRAREKPPKVHYIQRTIESQQERTREGNREADTTGKRDEAGEEERRMTHFPLACRYKGV